MDDVIHCVVKQSWFSCRIRCSNHVATCDKLSRSFLKACNLMQEVFSSWCSSANMHCTHAVRNFVFSCVVYSLTSNTLNSTLLFIFVLVTPLTMHLLKDRSFYFLFIEDPSGKFNTIKLRL